VSTVKVRTRFQPTVETEVDEGEAVALERQGLLWSGTDKELAALHTDAELPAPGAPAKPTGANVPATEKKEGAGS
jgi:hypothetical protein